MTRRAPSSSRRRTSAASSWTPTAGWCQSFAPSTRTQPPNARGGSSTTACSVTAGRPRPGAPRRRTRAPRWRARPAASPAVARCLAGCPRCAPAVHPTTRGTWRAAPAGSLCPARRRPVPSHRVVRPRTSRLARTLAGAPGRLGGRRMARTAWMAAPAWAARCPSLRTRPWTAHATAGTAR